MNSNVFVSMADSFPKAIKMQKQNIHFSYLSQERKKEHEHMIKVKVPKALVDGGFGLCWITLHNHLAVKE